MDLEKYFDTISHSKLIEVLSRTIKDGRVISLIHRYMNSGVIENGKFVRNADDCMILCKSCKIFRIWVLYQEWKRTVRVYPKSIAKMKEKIEELTSRSNGWGNERRN